MIGCCAFAAKTGEKPAPWRAATDRDGGAPEARLSHPRQRRRKAVVTKRAAWCRSMRMTAAPNLRHCEEREARCSNPSSFIWCNTLFIGAAQPLHPTLPHKLEERGKEEYGRDTLKIQSSRFI
jgi:hypothetical protein